jgi:hypothetical protein
MWLPQNALNIQAHTCIFILAVSKKRKPIYIVDSTLLLLQQPIHLPLHGTQIVQGQVDRGKPDVGHLV